jgi:hypothetical protein
MSNPITMTDADLDALAERMVSRIVLAFRNAAAEAFALAEEAAERPGLDAHICNVLADWLDDRSLPRCAQRVKKLSLKGGDVLAITMPAHCSQDDMERMRGMVKEWRKEWLPADVAVVCFVDGIRVSVIEVEREAN